MNNESSLSMTQLARKETILNNRKLIENSFQLIIHIDLVSLPKVISDHIENVILFSTVKLKLRRNFLQFNHRF